VGQALMASAPSYYDLQILGAEIMKAYGRGAVEGHARTRAASRAFQLVLGWQAMQRLKKSNKSKPKVRRMP